MQVVVAHNGWLVATVFLSNSIGCVLAAYCLVRVSDEGRTRRRRIVLALLAGWALVETSYHDMLFIIATGLKNEGVSIRYALFPSGLTIAVLSILAAAVISFVSSRSRHYWVVIGGVFVGLIVAAASILALGSVRSDRTATVDLTATAPIVAGFAAAAALSMAFTIGATRRLLLAAAIMFLGTCITVMQYLLVARSLFGGPSSAAVTAADGVLPIGAILVTVAGFIVRTAALVVVTLSDTTASVRRKPAG